jgi:hypothetical protein
MPMVSLKLMADAARSMVEELPLEITQRTDSRSHSHIHINTDHGAVPHGGSYKGDMPMVSLKLMAGAARSMVVASARTMAAEIAAAPMVCNWVCKEGSGGGPREAIPGGVMGSRRACVLTERARNARSKVGEIAAHGRLDKYQDDINRSLRHNHM